MTFFIYITYEWLIAGKTPQSAFYLINLPTTCCTGSSTEKMPEWVIFCNDLTGHGGKTKIFKRCVFRYYGRQIPAAKEERRIIMFWFERPTPDCRKNWGHKEYFKFIRDFIFTFHPVFGKRRTDLPVCGWWNRVWWPESKDNAKKLLRALLQCPGKELHQQFDRFKESMAHCPNTKLAHTGMVTVGTGWHYQKRSLVMSGDAMNTAARIMQFLHTTESEIHRIQRCNRPAWIIKRMWQAESLVLPTWKGKTTT